MYFKAIGFPHTERWRSSARLWCGAFVGWVLKSCGVTTPKGSNLAAVASFNAMKKLHVPPGRSVLPGDVVTYKSWSHVEFVRYWPMNPHMRIFYADGGNTTAGNDQHGVYINIPRPKAIVRHTIRFIPES